MYWSYETVPLTYSQSDYSGVWANKGEQNFGIESSALSDDRIYSGEGLSRR